MKDIHDEVPGKHNMHITKNHLEVLNREPESDEILFQHSALCQTFLPYRKPPNDMEAYVRRQGKLTTILTPHQIEGNDGQLIDIGLPYGHKSRLILYTANTLALQNKNPKIYVGKNMAEFIRNLNIKGTSGRYNHQIIEQLIRLKKTTISFHFKGETHNVISDRFIFTTIGFPKYDGKDSLPDMIQVKSDLGGIYLEFDNQYYESLQTHAVPMDQRGIKICARNARALDIYAWLVMRLQKIKNPTTGDFVAWNNLWEQFGGYDTPEAGFSSIVMQEEKSN